MEQVHVSQGKNELTKRDHITMVLHYGQIDRWVSFEKGEVIINSDNSDEIEIGQEVKISETLFVKWIKLLTLVDRSDKRKEDHHVKRNVSSISQEIGYSTRKGFYKVIKPLYEVGLVNLKETKEGGKNMIDVLVYPYPIYADSPLCVLKKCRSWNERNGFGFSLSSSGVTARRNKSTQVTEQKYTSEGTKVHKEAEQKYTSDGNESTQAPVYKSTLEPVYKSTHSNIYKISKDNNISKDHNIIIQNLDISVINSLERFKEEFDVTDDEMTEIILRLENFKPRTKQYASHRKYLQKTLATVRDEIQRSKKQAAKEGVMPKWLLKELEQEGDESQEFVDKPSNSEEDSRSFEDMLEELRMLREKRRAN